MTNPANPATTAPAPAPIDHDALPPGGGSYTRQSDGTLVSNEAPTTPATTTATDTPTE